MKERILVVRKMSALEYYYNGKHQSQVLRDSHENHNQAVGLIEDILRKASKEYEIVTRRQLTEDLVAESSAVISAGGDGTVIASAYFNIKTPQLNLKTDDKSIGFLCQQDVNSAMESFLNNEYRTEKWTREDVCLDEKFIGRALNETCIGEQLKFTKLAVYNLAFVEEPSERILEENQSSSGLIIATGTGSTGWGKTFKAYPRDSNQLKSSAVNIHSGELDTGTFSYIRIKYQKHEGKIAIDGVEHDFPRDSVLEIRVSQNPLIVMIPLTKKEL